MTVGCLDSAVTGGVEAGPVNIAAAQVKIGELAQCAGVTVRTVRWYCDQGLLSPVCRKTAGYRLFDANALARPELIRTLREIGLDLPVVKTGSAPRPEAARRGRRSRRRAGSADPLSAAASCS